MGKRRTAPHKVNKCDNNDSSRGSSAKRGEAGGTLSRKGGGEQAAGAREFSEPSMPIGEHQRYL